MGKIFVWVGICGQNICNHAALFVIPFNLICNMTVLKKLNFETKGQGEQGGVGGGFCVQNICYQVAAFTIPFNLTCNMTVF